MLLPFLAHGEFPSTKNSGQIEQNLFYVAITRAQKRLSLFVPEVEHLRSDYMIALQLEQVWRPAQLRLAQLRGERVDLQVPYAQKDEAKAMGARWDPEKRLWYVPADVNAAAFTRWMA